jgi:hypothetical protein
MVILYCMKRSIRGMLPFPHQRSEEIGESFEEALKSVRKTEAGRQLEELGKGPHRDERAAQWQEDMSRERTEERRREEQG